MSATLPTVAPHWPSLAAVPDWLERAHGAGAASIVVPEIIFALRAGDLLHRIPVKPRLNRFHEERLPPGLGHQRGIPLTNNWIVVLDWDAADADWQDGTVGGWKKRNGRRERLPIQTPWETINAVTPELLKRETKITPTKNPGGAPARYDWMAFAREIVRLAHTPDGLPDPPELLKHMRAWCLKNWGNETADSTLRDYISRLDPRTGT